MKKIFLSVLFVTFVSTIFAQEETLKGQKGDWGISIGISGIINNIKLDNSQDPAGNYMAFGRKYIKDDVAIRIGVNMALFKDKLNQEDSVVLGSGNTALRQIDSSYSRFDFSFSLGYEKHLGSTKRLDPYFAGEMMLGRLGNTEIKQNTNITDVTGTDRTQQIGQFDGGFYFGLGVAAGFNYFIAPKFSLGAEFGYAYVFMRDGGDYNVSYVNTPVSGAQYSAFNVGKRERSTSSINMSNTSTITLSYFF